MRLEYYKTRREKLKYIEIVYSLFTESVFNMVKEHYDKPEFDGTVFFLNIWFNSPELELFSPKYFEGKRHIYYFLEHNSDLRAYPDFYNDFFRWAGEFGIDEIWSMEIETNKLSKYTNIPIKFMPLRYCSTIAEKRIINPKKTTDLGFVGVVDRDVAPKRDDFIHSFRDGYMYSLKILMGAPMSELIDEICSCRFMLDLNRRYTLDSYTQNQVRIFEYLCLGCTVLQEKTKNNVFGNLIYEWNDINEMYHLVETIIPRDVSEEYKKLTYSDEDYNNYRDSLLNQ